MAEEIDYAQLNYEALMQIEADNYIQMKGNRPSSPENRLLMDLGSVVGCALVTYSGWIFLYRVARGHWPNPIMLALSPLHYIGLELFDFSAWLEQKIADIIHDLFGIGGDDPPSQQELDCEAAWAGCRQIAGNNLMKQMACDAEKEQCLSQQ